jgi:hypothetical protein
VTAPDEPDRTIGGLAGTAVSRAKEALGHAASDGEAADARQTRERDQAKRAVRVAEDPHVAAVQEANRPAR